MKKMEFTDGEFGNEVDSVESNQSQKKEVSEKMNNNEAITSFIDAMLDDNGSFSRFLKSYVSKGNIYAYKVFDAKKVYEKILKVASEKRLSHEDLMKYCKETVAIALLLGNVKKYQIDNCVEADKQRISALISLWGIDIGDHAKHYSKLSLDAIIFTSFIAVFPQIASMLMLKTPTNFISKLPTEHPIRFPAGTYRLPIVMKHSGFAGLIPRTCMKAFTEMLEICNLGFMVEFGRKINPTDQKPFSVAYKEKKTFKNDVMDGVVPENKRIAFIYAFQLNSVENAKIMLDVCAGVYTAISLRFPFHSDTFAASTLDNGTIRIVDDINMHNAYVAEAANILNSDIVEIIGTGFDQTTVQAGATASSSTGSLI